MTTPPRPDAPQWARPQKKESTGAFGKGFGVASGILTALFVFGLFMLVAFAGCVASLG